MGRSYVDNNRRLTLDPKFVDRSVLDLARERVTYVFDLFDFLYVSFSGGKDSTVVLHLALDEATKRGRLPLLVAHYDEEAIPYQTEQYVRRVAERPDIDLRWYCLPVKHRNACSPKQPWWFPWAPEDRDKWVRPLPPEAITDLPGFERGMVIPDCNGLVVPPSYGRVGVLMGIRAQESLIRRSAVSRRRTDNFIIPASGNPWAAERHGTRVYDGHVSKIYPIYDWLTEDVWTAPAQLGWDYNQAYDVMELAGIPHSLQRCCPPYGEEPLGNLWMFSHCFPEIWDRMVDRVPGAAAAARYAKTELYGFSKRPEKPADMSWPDFIEHYLLKFDPKTRRAVAERIATLMATHYRLTNDPILERTPHPETGVSWPFLLAIAMRGDFKQRRNPRGRVTAGKSDLDALWRAYNAERAESGV